jgi:phosphoribosylamine--glycine ligase
VDHASIRMNRTVSSAMPEVGKINVVLIGGGGREHALGVKLRESARLGELFIANPENPGLAALGPAVGVPVSTREAYRLVQFCAKNAIGLVVIGPEDPLAEGFADKLRAEGIRVFGPNADGARLEADKAWSKQLMRSASIPTAEGRIFTDPAAAQAWLQSREHPPVVKAAGLAKGKGVVVPADLGEAAEAIDRIMVKRVFGDAGRTVVLEERLSGPEVSVLALVDGQSIYLLETCQDHKRLLDNDEGPNTGGMGAFCPARGVDDALMEKVQGQILVPTLDALRREGIDFRGVLYAGLMLTPAGPKVLEYNVRFGDPECQALMPRLESDLLEVMLAVCDQRLHEVELRWTPGASCCVVLAADGYPEKPRSGDVITGIDDAEALPDVRVYHAGTKRNADGDIVTAGGRVLTVAATGEDLEDARRKAYAACDRIDFRGKQLRRDIGASGQAAARR